MALLKVKIELNKGRRGIKLEKLGKINAEIESFLQSLGNDVSLPKDNGEWLAINFENSSLIFDAEYQGQVTDYDILAFNEGFFTVQSYGADKEIKSNGISLKTLSQYAGIAKAIDIDEVVTFGIYQDEKIIRPIVLSKKEATNINEKIDQHIEYRGSFQGIPYSLTKGEKGYSFKLRRLVDNDLITCYFPKKMYQGIIPIFNRDDTIAYVAGLIKANKITRKIDSVNVEKIDIAPILKESDIDNFIGCAPDITGGLSTSEFINSIRDDNEQYQ